MNNKPKETSEHGTIIKCVSKKSAAMIQVTVPETDQDIITWLPYRTSAERIDKHTYQMLVNYCGTFFQLNKDILGSYLDALIDPKSLTHFYGIKNWNGHLYPCQTKLTPAFIRKFVELGDVLIRYELNIGNQSANALGMRIPVFEHRIAEFEVIRATRNAFCRNCDSVIERSDIKYCFVTRDISEGEAEVFESVLGEDHQIVSFIRKSVHAQYLEERNLEQIASDINNYEKRLQRIIDSLSCEIDAYKSTLTSKESDCGLTFVKTHDERILQKYRVLICNGVRDTFNINISFPANYMSCSQSPSILSFIQKNSVEVDIQHLYVETLNV